MTTASTIMISKASAKAIRLPSNRLSMPSKGGIHSDKRAIASAANNTIAPCAKLNTPEALKINTKPSATNEYNTPAIRPPSATSMKNPIFRLR